MSASEKLAGLDADIRSDEAFEVLRTEIATDALVAALPQIVAVVEAAEAWADDSADLGSIKAGEVPSNSELLHFALAALDKALTPKED